MRKKIAVIGEGFLGSNFTSGKKLRRLKVFDRDTLSISTTSDLRSCQKLLLDKYDVVVNCIAKSNTRFCEDHYQSAYYSNVIVPKLLNKYCAETGKKFVHISTGCLYDINSQPQTETSSLAAHCNYTLTKWQAEKELEGNSDALILRPRLLFDASDKPVNLLSKISGFKALCNEIDSITSLDVLQTAILKLVEADAAGVFNIACDGYASMYEIGEMLGLDKPKTSIEEIRIQQGLHLVNNIMCINKLKNYYKPPHILDEIQRCWSQKPHVSL